MCDIRCHYALTMCRYVYQCALVKNSTGVLYITGLPNIVYFHETSYRWDHIIISVHILDRIMIFVPASQLCFLQVFYFILIYHSYLENGTRNQMLFLIPCGSALVEILTVYCCSPTSFLAFKI